MAAIKSQLDAVRTVIVAEHLKEKQRASLKDVKDAAGWIVGPICGRKARHFDEKEVSRILHAYLVGRHAGVKCEYPINTGAKQRIDFRFGDRPYGANPVVLELAVRNYNGAPELIAGQNKSELSKLSRFPASKAQTRVLLLIDLSQSSYCRS